MKCIYCSKEALTDLIVCFDCLLKDPRRAFKYILARKIYDSLSTEEYKSVAEVAEELSANVHTVRDTFKLLMIYDLVEARWKLKRGIWSSVWRKKIPTTEEIEKKLKNHDRIIKIEGDDWEKHFPIKIVDPEGHTYYIYEDQVYLKVGNELRWISDISVLAQTIALKYFPSVG